MENIHFFSQMGSFQNRFEIVDTVDDNKSLINVFHVQSCDLEIRSKVKTSRIVVLGDTPASQFLTNIGVTAAGHLKDWDSISGFRYSNIFQSYFSVSSSDV